MSNTNNVPEHGAGYLEISEKGFGFLRTPENHFHPKPSDIFVTPDTIKRHFLREGSQVAGPTQPPHRGNSPQLRSVEKVNDLIGLDDALLFSSPSEMINSARLRCRPCLAFSRPR